MSKWLCILAVCCCAPALALPPPTTEDEMSRFMADKGILGRIEQASHTVRDRASELVVTAMGFLGVPYRRGGNSVETGFDCSGFVRAMYQQVAGLVLPRRADEQAAATHTIAKADLQPGDLVFFNTMRRTFSHVGIYVGDNKFIHSPRAGSEIRVEDMSVAYWSRRFDGARRVGGGSVERPLAPAQTGGGLQTAAVPGPSPEAARVVELLP